MVKINKFNNYETQILIYMSLIGVFYCITTIEMITLYISIEMISFINVIIILVKETKKSSYIAIIYFIINSISSIFILISILLIYKNIGIINIFDLELIQFINHIDINPINILIMGLILKLGAAPFHY